MISPLINKTHHYIYQIIQQKAIQQPILKQTSFGKNHSSATLSGADIEVKSGYLTKLLMNACVYWLHNYMNDSSIMADSTNHKDIKYNNLTN
jgi:hypothetical protein